MNYDKNDELEEAKHHSKHHSTKKGMDWAEPKMKGAHKDGAMGKKGVKIPVTQLHWGGGTPTFLSHQEMTELMQTIRQHFDLRPYGITRMLNLLQPMYEQTASYGHFGRQGTETAFTWERTDRAALLRADAGL